MSKNKMDKWLNGISLGKYNDFTDKQESVSFYTSFMLARTQSMFKYENLPSTIPQRMLELYLQGNGCVGIISHNGNMYAVAGGLGGEPDAYYMPTIFTVANPALKLSKNFKVGEECIVISNDSMYLGLLGLFSRYASLLADNDISLRIADINSRIISLISSGTDSEKKAADIYLEQIVAGKLGIIASNSFTESIKAQPYATRTGVLTDLIESRQYIKASMYNDIGLNANYNMKRESLNSAESQMNNDALMPFVDDMLRCREIGIEAVNEMFGLDIKVSLNTVWEVKEEEQYQVLQNLVNDNEAVTLDDAFEEAVDLAEKSPVERLDDINTPLELNTEDEVEGTDIEVENYSENESQESTETSVSSTEETLEERKEREEDEENVSK